jgi:hypothetical protein
MQDSSRSSWSSLKSTRPQRNVVGLTDAHPSSPQCLESCHLERLVLWPQVEVQSVLHDLVVAHLKEQQVGADTVLRTPGSRLERDLVIGLMRAAPPECFLPEVGEFERVVGVDAETLKAKSHEGSLLLVRGLVQRHPAPRRSCPISARSGRRAAL